MDDNDEAFERDSFNVNSRKARNCLIRAEQSHTTPFKAFTTCSRECRRGRIFLRSIKVSDDQPTVATIDNRMHDSA